MQPTPDGVPSESVKSKAAVSSSFVNRLHAETGMFAAAAGGPDSNPMPRPALATTATDRANRLGFDISVTARLNVKTLRYR